MNSNKTSRNDLADPLLTTKFIANDLSITDRGLRKRIAGGRFPIADANINGRNYWLTSTYRKWKTAALNGEFSQPCGLSADRATLRTTE